MELNIDIAGQLFPNPLTMVIQWCATLILLYFVKKFLWEPAREYLNKRASYAQNQISEAEALKSEAHNLNLNAKAEIKDAGAVARGLIDNAKTESALLKEQLLRDAKKESDAKLDAARREIEYEKKQMRDDVAKEIIDVALDATEKLLGTKITAQEDHMALQKFIKDVNA